MSCRLKPGSLTADGVVVPLFPVRGDPMQEPAVVPVSYGASLRHLLGRCRALEQAGWVLCPAVFWPQVIGRDQTCLIHRNSGAYRTWLAEPLDTLLSEATR